RSLPLCLQLFLPVEDGADCHRRHQCPVVLVRRTREARAAGRRAAGRFLRQDHCGTVVDDLGGRDRAGPSDSLSGVTTCPTRGPDTIDVISDGPAIPGHLLFADATRSTTFPACPRNRTPSWPA